MVVHHFNLDGLPCLEPQADAPLSVDPNAPLTAPVTTQFLQPIAGWDAQVVKGCGSMQRTQLVKGTLRNLERVGLRKSIALCPSIARSDPGTATHGR